jgi:prepilin-type processing-associated H-X9-DG protein
MRLPKVSKPIRVLLQWIGIGTAILACSLLLVGKYHRITTHMSCMKNQIQIGTAMAMYSQDWDDRLPPSTHWADSVLPYIITREKVDELPHDASAFHCPSSQASYSYLFNFHLANLPRSRIAHQEQTPLVYEQEGTVFNAVGDGQTIPPLYRHEGQTQILFVDGHTKSYTPETERDIQW